MNTFAKHANNKNEKTFSPMMEMPEFKKDDKFHDFLGSVPRKKSLRKG